MFKIKMYKINHVNIIILTTFNVYLVYYNYHISLPV